MPETVPVMTPEAMPVILPEVAPVTTPEAMPVMVPEAAPMEATSEGEDPLERKRRRLITGKGIATEGVRPSEPC